MKYILILIYLSSSGHPAMVAVPGLYDSENECYLSGLVVKPDKERGVVDYLCVPAP